jgi:hypothetical protein
MSMIKKIVALFGVDDVHFGSFSLQWSMIKLLRRAL